MGENTFRIPGPAWKHEFDQPLDGVRGPAQLSNLGSIIKMMPMIVRLLRYTRKRKASGFFDPINITPQPGSGPYQGVPLGGIGGGSIGRGWRGDFRRWQLRPGVIYNPPVWADQFSLFVQRGDRPGQAQVLFPGRPDTGQLAAWQWGMSAECARYEALFPRAWTTYTDPLPGVQLVCRQLSPVIAHNYRESSLPVSEFRWKITNTGAEPATIGLMFTFQNGMGTANDMAGGHANQHFASEESRGVLLRHRYRQIQNRDPEAAEPETTPRQEYIDPLSFAIAASICPLAGCSGNGDEALEDSETLPVTETAGDISFCRRFVSSGDGADLWADFSADGRLDNVSDETPSAPGETIGAALAVTLTLPPGASREAAFTLAWDMPVARFGLGTAYHRRYTRFYGARGDAAPVLAVDALRESDDWEAQIEAWQRPILEDERLPGWYRAALFNELYYMVDGGVTWCHAFQTEPAEAEAAAAEPAPADREEETAAASPESLDAEERAALASAIIEDEDVAPPPTDLIGVLRELAEPPSIAADTQANASIDGEDDLGRFAYLEGLEYRMFNTYDVHFYASFALIANWPRIELALQRDVAEATLGGLPDQMTELYSGKRVPRKLAGAVPHDLGWPDEDPWNKPNGYFMHNVNHWKDLNPKFVLQVYRDYVATGDRQFVLDTWPAVKAALAYTARFDRDGDGIIENDGFPDQTYDVWTVRGASAYTGGLWLAALQAGGCLAEIAGETDLAAGYRQMLERGKAAYESKLWNGRYFNYDSSASRQHDSIMADQMAGQWYTRACGLVPIVNPLFARAALLTVYDWNVMRFQNGAMGAVNGMRPDGKVDRSSMQSQEVWSGTTYAVAAAMLYEDLPKEAFAAAAGVAKTTYEETGFWFQTPEAWIANGNYRSIAYMRPLAIWAMQWALEHKT